ncbi:MAG: hypothetical protein ABSC37_19350 [Xanthobacteraceae bacterium]
MVDFGYFRTPQFYARLRNLDDEMRHGFRFELSRIKEYLGCDSSDFIDYLRQIADEDNIAYVDIGNGECISFDVPRDRSSIDAINNNATFDELQKAREALAAFVAMFDATGKILGDKAPPRLASLVERLGARTAD